MAVLTPLLAPDDGDHGDQAHERADMRSNMFVVAALYCDRGSSPVRIRNMSRSGALIESAVIPPEQSPVRLSRGSLAVVGQIVWRKDNRAGIRFDAAVEVGNWLPGGGHSTAQQRVDEIVHSCRTTHSNQPEPATAAPTAPPALAELAGQLVEIKHALNAMGEVLAEDMAVAMAHSTELQTIDISVQKLERIAAFLAVRT